MLPDRMTASSLTETSAVHALLSAVRRRLATMLMLEAISAGSVLSAAIVVGGWALHVGSSWTLIAGAAAGAALATGVLIHGRRRLTARSIAAEVERRHPGLDNLLVTMTELVYQPRPVHPVIASELRRQADARARGVAVDGVAPLGRAVSLAIVVVLGAGLAWHTARRDEAPGVAPTQSIVSMAGDRQEPAITITVTPPAYTGLPPSTIAVGCTADVRSGGSSEPHNRVEALEGSRVRIEISPATVEAQLVASGRRPLSFERSGDVRSIERTAEHTEFLLVKFGQDAIPDRLLSLVVHPDAAPVVRIRQPARDLIFPEPSGRVKVEVEATDDLALSVLSLHYTRVFGSGESVTFQEGDLPLRVERVGAGQWQASSEISLEDLQLADGDTLVYRAVTMDSRPGRDPSSSEAYLLEIGKRAEATSAGFALPEDKERQGISQQMVIVKTERLLAERNRLSREEVEERARLLAVEQRMVRAEFVFMTGGEVEDEVAEAEHSHELAEGRFENEGQVELLTAIREMSRAEARLNEASVDAALGFERAALKALQRAFDRRRYLLRTMPERARIDQGRRLTGSQTDARSWRRQAPAGADRQAVASLQALASDLARAGGSADDLGPLAARVGAIDPAQPEVQKVALQLAAAGASGPARSAAIADALRLIGDRARHALSPTRAWVPHDAAAGRYADALAQRSRQR